MKTIVIGLGNPILGDDGVGWKVAETVREHIQPDLAVEVECLALGGISLMERLVGSERAILIDALISDDEPGSINVSNLEDLPDTSAFHMTSAHDMSLQNALKLGRSLDAKLPNEVIVVGISANHVYDFSEELSPPVKDAVPKATQIVVNLIKQNITIH